MGDKVAARGEKEATGTVVGTRPCQLTGCRGLNLITKWPGGKRTTPCTKGMYKNDDTWRLL